PASGGTLTPLTTFDRGMDDIVHAWPQLLPRGRFLYWYFSSKPELTGVIYAGSFEKPNERIKLLRSETRALYTSGPDGQGFLLWQRNGALVAQAFDTSTLTFSGEPRLIADAVGIENAGGMVTATVSTTGTLVYAVPDLQQLTWFDRDGQPRGTLDQPGQFHPVIRFSHDGQQIALTRMEVGRELWLIDVARGTSRRTTYDPGGGFTPQWSPDD